MKRPTRYSNNRRKHVNFWGACLFARRWTWYPQFHQANRISHMDQQIISSFLGHEKKSSLLQTFKNTSVEFSMLQQKSRTCWKASSTFFHPLSLPQLVFQDKEDVSLQVPTNQLLGPHSRGSIQWSLLLSFCNNWWV